MKILITLILISTYVFGQQNQIFVDEQFDDWNNNSYYEDENNNLTYNLDFKKLWISNDSNYLFIRLDFYNYVLIQEDTNAVLLLNTDNNLLTGTNEYNSGAEIKFNFGKHFGYYYFDDDSIQIFQDDLKYISAPTVSTNILEFSFELRNEINQTILFSSDTLNVKFVNYYSKEDEIPNDNAFYEYVIKRDNSFSYPEIKIAKNNPEDIRLVSYNVHRDDIFLEEKKDSYQRIFNSIKPDIIAFQEIYNHSSEEIVNLIESFLPSSDGERWYHSKIAPIDTNQYNVTDNIVVSRYPIINSYRIQGFTYEQYGIDKSNAAYLIDLPEVEKNLLLIVAHPPCCRNYFFRQIELQEIMSFIRDAKSTGGDIDIQVNTPIIIAGDMNLVGPYYERNILLYGDLIDNSTYGEDFNPDWDKTSFADARPYTTGYPGVFTWYRETDIYSPGRLDYIIYSDYTLNLENSFSLFTKTIPNTILEANNLEPDDVSLASDHLPLVCDFTLKNTVGINNENNIPNKFSVLYQNYPNPFNPSTKISYSIPEQSNVSLKIFDVLGREISTLVNEEQASGNYTIEFDASSLKSGVYFYRLQNGSFSETKKFILLK